MILPDDVKCKICAKVFCCSKCRLNHQDKIHKDHNNDVNDKKKEQFSCVICYNQPFILYPKMPDNVLIHIAEKHLPLYCKKCCKFYNSIDDLVIFSKCTNEIKHECNLLESKNLIKKDNNELLPPIGNIISEMGTMSSTENCTSIGIQTSPCLNETDIKKLNNISNSNNNSKNVTNQNLQSNDFTPPMSVVNLNWKLKDNHKGNLDSLSSIRNFSSIHHSNSLSSSSSALLAGKCISKIETKIGKVQTTTSTPMPATFKKINEKGFDASSCQVSSIHSIHTSTESDNNSPVTQNVQTPSSSSSSLTNPVESNKNKTVNTAQNIRCRPKLHISTTPLRQVMSKSIQKAIVEHGIMRGAYPKKIFDPTNNRVSISTNSPLDLRTTPALRRTYSEVIQKNSAYKEFLSSATNKRNNYNTSTSTDTKNEIHFTSKQLTTEFMITSTSSKMSSCYEKSNTIYKTCQSIEVVTTTTGIQNLKYRQQNEQNLLPNNDNEINNEKLEQISSLVTPKISGLSAPIKKTISFETPNSNCDSSSDVSDEIFYTPQKSPPKRMPNNINNNNNDIMKNKELIKNNTEEKEKINDRNNNGGLWSILTSMIRFKSFGEEKIDNSKGNKDFEKSSLIKRCASFAGVLTKPKKIDNDDSTNQAHKRKRTISSTTNDSQTMRSSSLLQNNSNNNNNNNTTISQDSTSPPKRIRRIQGRKPIERMRNFS